MAFDTIAFDHHSMTALLILEHHFFVAFETNPAGIFVQKFTMRGRMGIMTFRTFSHFYRGMDKWMVKLLLKILVAVQAKFPLRIGLQPKLILGVGY
jgi:hypothetical protein